MILSEFLYKAGSVIWGTPTVILFLFTATRFTLKSKFYQIRCPKMIFRNTLGTIFKPKKTHGISPFSAFCSVLGACLGTGNIVGVATALYSGGPGTVFWMLLSAVFSSMTAYAESFLGGKYSNKTSNTTGVYAYMEGGLKSKATAKIYGIFALCSAVTMGNITQSNSLAQALKSSFNVHPALTGIVIAILCGFILWGGVKRIAKIQTVLVPLMTVCFLTLSFMVIFKYRNNILPSVALIFKEAFTIKSLKGYGIFKATRYGISRGVFSNEAGLGSATLLHTSSSDTTPEAQGMWAITEVFTDTVIMCTITALVILTSGADYTALYGAELSLTAFSNIGNWAGKIISLLTSVFAFTSLTSCSFYGETASDYLFCARNKKIYKITYIICVFAGCINPPKIAWAIADICNGLMALPNLYAINCLGNRVEYP